MCKSITILSSLFSLLLTGVVAQTPTCTTCTITCGTQTVTSGACSFEVTLQCNDAWTGEICFSCDSPGIFTLTEITPLATSGGTCALPEEPTPNLSEFSLECGDSLGNEAFLTVVNTLYDSKSSKSSKSSKGSKGGRGRGRAGFRELERENPSHGRSLRRAKPGSKKSKGSSALEEKMCFVPLSS